MSTSLGDTKMHEAADIGPVFGPILVVGSWVVSVVASAFASIETRVDALDRFFEVGTHGAMFLTAMYGAYRLFGRILAKQWDQLRRRKSPPR